ncbi:MAG TPA: OmpH family outer membrane protein [Chryseolinea sp.]|nr:OmpH family outer membrane protein [Chryseolinea sp.]
MKNLSLILNAILLVAVGVLYYLHFSGGKSSGTTESAVTPSDLKIAYINADTVLKYYEYLKTTKVKMEEKTKKMDADYRNRAMGLQNEIAAYQRNVSNMTLGQVKAVEEDLGKKQQNLQMYQQSLGQQLMAEESKIQKELYDRITVFLKKYGSEKGLQIVLKFDPTSDLLFAGQPLDISQDVITGLNAAYKLESTKTKADSTATK